MVCSNYQSSTTLANRPQLDNLLGQLREGEEAVTPFWPYVAMSCPCAGLLCQRAASSRGSAAPVAKNDDGACQCSQIGFCLAEKCKSSELR